MCALLKDICKEKKNDLHYTNQTISKLTNMSINTINTYFSGASKSPSVYTVGPICAALGVSLDKYFGIDGSTPNETAAELAALQEQYETLQSDLEHSSMESQREADQNQKLIEQLSARLKNQKLFSMGVLIALCIILALFVAYLICFDIPNPNYGIFRSEAFM